MTNNIDKKLELKRQARNIGQNHTDCFYKAV